MRGRAQDPDPPARVLDDYEDVVGRAGECGRGEEIARHNCLCLTAEEADQVWRFRWGAGSIPCCLRISHTVEAATVTPSVVSSPWIRR